MTPTVVRKECDSLFSLMDIQYMNLERKSLQGPEVPTPTTPDTYVRPLAAKQPVSSPDLVSDVVAQMKFLHEMPSSI